MTRILLVGATGLVGQRLLQQLLRDDTVSHIYAPTRRALPTHPKLVNVVGEDLRLLLDGLTEPVDTVFGCLGSTQADAGSKNAFHYVDYVLPVYTGQVAKQLHAQCYVVISALGATPRSPFLYSRTKGAMEQALQAQDWPYLTIVRPSMLIGEREKPRWLERLSAPLFAVLPGKWRAISADTVAQAMWQCAAALPLAPVRIIESDQLHRLGAGSERPR